MIWTGDNTGDWSYLQTSIKMCMASAVSGFSFCGADVGGLRSLVVSLGIRQH